MSTLRKTVGYALGIALLGLGVLDVLPGVLSGACGAVGVTLLLVSAVTSLRQAGQGLPPSGEEAGIGYYAGAHHQPHHDARGGFHGGGHGGFHGGGHGGGGHGGH